MTLSPGDQPLWGLAGVFTVVICSFTLAYTPMLPPTKLLLPLLACCLLGLWAGCDRDAICVRAQDPVETRSLSLPSFTGIDLRLPATLYLTQDTAFAVSITGPANVLDQLQMDVTDGVWEASLRGCILDAGTIEIAASLPSLHYLRIAGKGDVEGVTPFVVPAASLIISGTGTLDLALVAEEVSATISGAGDIVLQVETPVLTSQINGTGDLVYSGTASTHSCEIRGTGSLEAFPLKTQRTEITVAGAGQAELFASERLSVHITGSGDVRYRGHPQLDLRVEGTGRVIDAN